MTLDIKWCSLPPKEVPMRPVNEYQFYELALAVHPLAKIAQSARYSELWLDWISSREALQNIFKQRSLEFCYQVANELYQAINKVVPEDFDEAITKLHTDTTTAEPELGWALTYPVKSAAEKFETLLSAELSNSDTYWIEPKGTHKTSVLLQFAHRELPSDVVQQAPEVAKDFDEAGKCLLFDTPTAVGFHLLRATEAIIRRYYKVVVGVEPKTKFRNWGAYIKVLRTSGANPKVTGYLDHIREHYRNPILHPEVDLSVDDAQVLFGVCVSAIVMMAGEIKTLTAKGGNLPFPALPSAVGVPE